MTDLVSRKRALELGLKQFYTGEPCKYGHVELRFASSGACLQCDRDRNKTEKRRQRSRDNYYKDPEHHKARRLKWRAENLARDNETKRLCKARARVKSQK